MRDRAVRPEPETEDVMQPDPQPLAPAVGEDLCAACNGTGMVEGERCAVCGGPGEVLQGIGGG
jgi:hypothetical protein